MTENHPLRQGLDMGPGGPDGGFDASTCAMPPLIGHVRGAGAPFTVDTMARYRVHDPIHHVGDVTSPSG